MKKHLLLCSLILCSLFLGITHLHAEVAPGENLLVNGEFASDDIDQQTGLDVKSPTFWSATGATKNVSFSLKDVPAGKGIVKLAAPKGETSPEATMRQMDLTLVPRGKYRISAMVKTTGFKSPHCGITVYDFGCNNESGLTKFPENQDWKRMSADITLMPSRENWYGFVLFACDFTGSIEIADVKLEALSDDALKGSKTSGLVKQLAAPKLVPWKPLLNNIAIPNDGKAPAMTFRFFGKLPEDTMKDYEVQYTVNGGAAMKAPLTTPEITLPLSTIKTPGDFALAVSIVNKATGKVVYERTHSATAIVLPPTSDKGHKRLNNLVVEILNAPLAKTAATQKFDFCMMRSGWIFIAAQNAAAENLEITLDGKLTRSEERRVGKEC